MDKTLSLSLMDLMQRWRCATEEWTKRCPAWLPIHIVGKTVDIGAGSVVEREGEEEAAPERRKRGERNTIITKEKAWQRWWTSERHRWWKLRAA